MVKNVNRYRLDQTPPPHKIIEWDSANSDSQPTDDELNAASTAWKAANDYKENRRLAYPKFQDQFDMQSLRINTIIDRCNQGFS